MSRDLIKRQIVEQLVSKGMKQGEAEITVSVAMDAADAAFLTMHAHIDQHSGTRYLNMRSIALGMIINLAQSGQAQQHDLERRSGVNLFEIDMHVGEDAVSNNG